MVLSGHVCFAQRTLGPFRGICLERIDVIARETQKLRATLVRQDRYEQLFALGAAAYIHLNLLPFADKRNGKLDARFLTRKSNLEPACGGLTGGEDRPFAPPALQSTPLCHQVFAGPACALRAP